MKQIHCFMLKHCVVACAGGAVNTQLAWLGQNLVSFLAASEAYSINPAGDRKSAPDAEL